MPTPIDSPDVLASVINDLAGAPAFRDDVTGLEVQAELRSRGYEADDEALLCRLADRLRGEKRIRFDRDEYGVFSSCSGFTPL